MFIRALRASSAVVLISIGINLPQGAIDIEMLPSLVPLVVRVSCR